LFIGVFVCRSLVSVAVWVLPIYQSDLFDWCSTCRAGHFSNVSSTVLENF